MVVVREPDMSDADSHSESDIAETPVEQLIDTSSLSSSSQVSVSSSFLSPGAWHCWFEIKKSISALKILLQ